jgi:hypothetical protein
MMQAAKNHMCNDVRSARSSASAVHPSRARHECASHYNRWRFGEDPLKGLFVDYDQMIGALAPDRLNQAFSLGVLPGRAA